MDRHAVDGGQLGVTDVGGLQGAHVRRGHGLEGELGQGDGLGGAEELDADVAGGVTAGHSVDAGGVYVDDLVLEPGAAEGAVVIVEIVLQLPRGLAEAELHAGGGVVVPVGVPDRKGQVAYVMVSQIHDQGVPRAHGGLLYVGGDEGGVEGGEIGVGFLQVVGFHGGGPPGCLIFCLIERVQRFNGSRTKEDNRCRYPVRNLL